MAFASSLTSRRSARCLLLAAALALAATSPLPAQYPAPAAGVRTHTMPAFRSTLSASAAERIVIRASEGGGSRVLDRMGTGALIGAGVGLVAAFVHTEITGDYSDHSMDGLAYLVAIPMGTLAGLLVGFAVGVSGG